MRSSSLLPSLLLSLAVATSATHMNFTFYPKSIDCQGPAEVNMAHYGTTLDGSDLLSYCFNVSSVSCGCSVTKQALIWDGDRMQGVFEGSGMTGRGHCSAGGGVFFAEVEAGAKDGQEDAGLRSVSGPTGRCVHDGKGGSFLGVCEPPTDAEVKVTREDSRDVHRFMKC
jgi:hypothetical protein